MYVSISQTMFEFTYGPTMIEKYIVRDGLSEKGEKVELTLCWSLFREPFTVVAWNGLRGILRFCRVHTYTTKTSCGIFAASRERS